MLVQRLHELEDKENRQSGKSRKPAYLKYASITRAELSDMLDLGVLLKKEDKETK